MTGQVAYSNADKKYDAVLFFLHGFMETGQRYVDLYNSKEFPIPKNTKVVFLTSPIEMEVE